MKLTELDPEFIRWEDINLPHKYATMETNTPEKMEAWKKAGYPIIEKMEATSCLRTVHSLAEAQGIEIDCPVCKGPGKSHRIHVPFKDRGILDHQGTHDSNGRPTRWSIVSGTWFTDLTLSPSIDCTKSNPKCWHGFITNGEIT